MQSHSADGAVSAPDQQAEEPDRPADRATVLTELASLREAVAVLTDREQERAAHRESVIDRLHAENQTLRRRELEYMLEPVRMGLYRLYDLSRREAERWTGSQPPDSEHAGPLLAAIAEEIAEVLARTGVEPFEPVPGEPYDACRHRPIETADVTDPALDGAVVRTLNNGFCQGEKTVRRADVVVGQLRASKRKAATRIATRTPSVPGTKTGKNSKSPRGHETS